MGQQTVAIVLTDIEGSTRWWHAAPDAMLAAMLRHNAIVEAAVVEAGGWLPADQGEGDSRLAVFPTAAAAVRAAVDMQRRLAGEDWGSVSIRVRAGLHVGDITVREGRVYGEALAQAARVRALAHGGQMLVSEALHALAGDASGAASYVDLGHVRLRDFDRPQRVYQLVAPGLPTGFPALRQSSEVPRALPAVTTPLIGRAEELATLLQLVHDARLVTVTGFGGMGKTRLSLEAATRCLDRESGFGDGVWFVDLTSAGGDRVTDAVADVVGVHDAGDERRADLIAHLVARSCLLVLDNCEHVLAESGSLVVDLLAGCASLTVLATSRMPLGLAGERVLALGPLAAPAADVDGRSLSSYDAVALLVDRATAQDSSFRLNDDNAADVGAICRRLDGHPLALELAAPRLRLLTPAQLLNRLDRALPLLVGGGADRPERHRTLEATIAWSYDALSAGAQQLLARMSVLPAPAPVELVEALAGDDVDGLVELEVLVASSLVVRSATAAGPRFGLLVSIREFAGGRLDEAARLVSLRRHAQWCRERAAVERLHQVGPAWNAWVKVMAVDAAHYRQALDVLSSAPDPFPQLELTCDMLPLWEDLGGGAEGMTALLAALQRETADTEARAWGLFLLAELEWQGGLSEMFRRDIDVCVEAARRCGADAVAGYALAQLLPVESDLDVAMKLIAEIERPLERPWTSAWVQRESYAEHLANSRFWLLRYEDPAAVETHLDDLLPGTRAVHGAQLALDRGDVDLARRRLAPVLREDLRAGYVWPVVARLIDTQVDLAAGEFARARSGAFDVVETMRTLGRGDILPEALVTLGDAHWLCGDTDEAMSVWRDATAASVDATRPNLAAWRQAFATHDATALAASLERAAEDRPARRRRGLVWCLDAAALIAADADTVALARGLAQRERRHLVAAPLLAAELAELPPVEPADGPLPDLIEELAGLLRG